MLKNTFGGFVFVALLIAGSLFSLRDYSDPELGLQLGIDLQGGTELVYRIDRNKVAPSKRGTVLEDVKSVIASRFDAFGLKEIRIATSFLILWPPPAVMGSASHSNDRRGWRPTDALGPETGEIAGDETPCHYCRKRADAAGCGACGGGSWL